MDWKGGGGMGKKGMGRLLPFLLPAGVLALYALACGALFGAPVVGPLLLCLPFAGCLALGYASLRRRLARGGALLDPRELELLRVRADQDYLTGLSSRQATEEQVTRALRERPEGTHLFVIIDLDNFKRVNDEHGHLYGDEQLREAARRIRAAFSEGDVVGRVGGDEFAALVRDLPGPQAAEALLERLVRAQRESGGALSCSAGAAWYPSQGRTYRELFCAADEALYRAKQQGKDRYLLSQTP